MMLNSCTYWDAFNKKQVNLRKQKSHLHKGFASGDPKNFDAAAMLADLYWKDAKVEKDKMSSLGNSKADLSKSNGDR
jgi:hypothetical protein